MGAIHRKEVISVNIARKWILTAVVVGSMAGGAIGGTVISAATGNAANTKTVTTPSTGLGSGSGPSVAPSGTFKPNEDASHESGESAAREAQEDAGQFPTVP